MGTGSPHGRSILSSPASPFSRSRNLPLIRPLLRPRLCGFLLLAVLLPALVLLSANGPPVGREVRGSTAVVGLPPVELPAMELPARQPPLVGLSSTPASDVAVHSPPVPVRPSGLPLPQERHRRMVAGELPGRYPFYWTRAIYSGWGRRGWGRSWAVDYPKGDQQFIIVLKRLVRLDAYDWDNAVALDDPALRRFPVLYAVEVGGMELTDTEVEGLRGYLNAGGFLIVDDFWGNEWMVWEYNIRRVFPDRPIVDIGIDHPIYSAYYDIEEIKQVPARGRGIYGRPTEECYGCYPAVRGIYDDEGRLMVIINWNTDLGDAWEWAEDPSYPLEYSTYAYEMGANMIVYAMSH